MHKKDASFNTKHLVDWSNEFRKSSVYGSHEEANLHVDIKASRGSRHRHRELQKAAGMIVERSSYGGQLRFYNLRVSGQIKKECETRGRQEQDRRRADAKIKVRGRHKE